MTFIECLTGVTLADDEKALRVDIAPSFDAVAGTWERMTAGEALLPFQRRSWLEAWSKTLGRKPGAEMLAATVREADGTPLLAVPLVRYDRGLYREICPVDDGVSDYNAPIVTKRTPTDPDAATRIWRALLDALPAADVVRLERMPTHVGARPNPLAHLPGSRPASVDGLALDMAGSFAEWRQALPRRYRKELGRCGRLFDELPGARFERISGDAGAVFDVLERLQRQRIVGLGRAYRLDRPPARAFYRTLGSDLVTGPGVLTALTTDAGMVAALFGVRHGAHYVMLRIGACAEHARLSPARHLITRTMEHLAADGVGHFDFGLGDYPYKRKLGGRPLALRDLVVARTPLGFAEVARSRLGSHLRKTPGLRAAKSRLRALWQGTLAASPP